MKKSYKDKKPPDLVKPIEKVVQTNNVSPLSFTLSTSSDDDLSLSLRHITVKGRKRDFSKPVNKREREADYSDLNKSVIGFNKNQSNNNKIR